MQAWTKSGKSTTHLEPWGIFGSFSTLRLHSDGHLPFLEDYLLRLINSAKTLQQEWIPELNFIRDKLDEYLSTNSIEDGLIRICLFEDSVGISDRPAISDGQSVNGWLINYRRPIPSVKSTMEKQLYGRLSELDLASEDWIIIDPKDNDIRESATANIIFVNDNQLIIPEKRILQGIVLNQLLPHLKDSFSITRSAPKDQDIAQFNEILLCGTGRGVAPMKELSELGWKTRSDSAFKKIRSIYENLIAPPNA